MIISTRVTAAAAISLLCLAVSPASAQSTAIAPPPVSQGGELERTVAGAVHLQSFGFAAGSDASSANLVLIPLSFQQAFGAHAALDGYAAYGYGRVASGGKIYTLSAPVDSWLRIRWAMNTSTVLAMGVALPTGLERHNSEQSVVASILSNDLLGFREANWGGGGSVTVGASNARQSGSWKLTTGASYRMAGSFQPSADTSVRYAPGSEAKVRVGLERPVGTGSFFFGVTGQQIAVDKADKRNIFKSGPRLRTDLSYTAPSWSAFVTDLWRAHGDLTLPIVNLLDGTFIRDTVFQVGHQNLIVAGASRTIGLRQNLLVIPSTELKLKTREERAGRGWLGAAGVAVPFNLGSMEYFPSLKLTRGSLIPALDPSSARRFWGAEFSFVVRHASFRRSATGG
jgi:hypothetical protein